MYDKAGIKTWDHVSLLFSFVFVSVSLPPVFFCFWREPHARPQTVAPTFVQHAVNI